MTVERYDVVIAGAGITGLSVALLLRQQQLKIAIIEQQPASPFDPNQDIGLRVFAINAASQQLLQRADAWQAITAERHCAYHNMYVWEDTNTELQFHATDVNVARLGYIIEQDLIQSALLKALQQCSNIDLLCPCTIAEIITCDLHTDLILTSEQQLRTQLLIAADGADSQIRQLSGININQSSYMQSGLVATIQTEQFHQYTAWQRFLPTGPLAFLPLSDKRCSIVWSLPSDQVQSMLTLPKQAFCTALTQASAGKLGTVQQVGKRASFPLRQLQTNEYVAHRLALIGDSAHTVHPLAGQGVNLGLADVSALHGVIAEALAQHTDIGQLSVLRRYARKRQFNNQLMAETFGFLNQCFLTQHSEIQRLRRCGLRLVNHFLPLKQFLIREALGNNIQNTI